MKLILPNHRISKTEIDKNIHNLVLNKTSVQDLFSNFSLLEREKTFNALWILREVSPKLGFSFNPFANKLLDLLEYYYEDEGIIRNVVSICQFMDFDEEVEGEVLDYIFRYLSNHKWPIAIKVFSMTVGFNICKKYPELLEELKMLVQENLLLLGPDSPGIISRGSKTMKMITQHLHK